MGEIWRLIDSGRCGPAFNMALDEAIATAVRKDDSPPALRFYGWDMPSVSLGCFQKASDVDLDYCVERRIPVVRRPTGGRAILHGEELTYSFSIRTDRQPFSRGLLDSYKEISRAFCLTLKKIKIEAEPRRQREKGSVLAGSPLCFQSSSFGEILVGSRKVVGAAQKRWEDGLLQQGSIPYFYSAETVAVFGIKADEGLRERMTGLKEIAPGLEEDEFKRAIAASFEETFGVSLVSSPPSQEELSLARELERLKYLQPQWTLRR